MFLKGQLMGYGLQTEDFAAYRNSDYIYFTPGTTIFFMILNGYTDVINEREANKGFDTTKEDLQTMTLLSFRKAMAVTYDKELFCTTVSPARSGGYGIIGTGYIYDPYTGAEGVGGAVLGPGLLVLDALAHGPGLQVAVEGIALDHIEFPLRNRAMT